MSGVEMGRIRTGRNRDLERYVKRDARGYVRYKHPKMPKPQHFGKDAAQANEVARIINAKLSDHSLVVDRILNPAPQVDKPTVSEVIRRFELERLPQLQWSPDYQKENMNKLRSVASDVGSIRLSDLTILDLNKIIDSNFSGDGRRLARNVLIHLYRYAIGRGLHAGVNIAEQVLAIPKAARVRHRIKNLADLMIIRSHANEVCQDAIDISLITLQARMELCNMLLKHDSGDTLTVIRQKTAGEHKTAKKASKKVNKAYIKISVGSDLRKVLHRCKVKALRYGSPFYLNHPSRVRSKYKAHRTQVLPRYLSQCFTDAVNACGLYDDLDLIGRPTLHEVRSLGGRIYKAMGKSEEFIQSLYGHSKIDMTEGYLEGDEIVWSAAAADMDLAMAATVRIKE